MWVQFWAVIGVNKITDINIDFGLNHGFWSSYYKKIYVLVNDYYQ